MKCKFSMKNLLFYNLERYFLLFLFVFALFLWHMADKINVEFQLMQLSQKQLDVVFKCQSADNCP